MPYGEWNPIRYRDGRTLPDDGEQVLLFYPWRTGGYSYEVGTMHRSIGRKPYFVICDEWSMYAYDFAAWMPLPAPYKEGLRR